MNSNIIGSNKYVDSLSTFNTLKISAGKNNEYYTVNNGTQVYGKPDIFWDNIVFIENESYIWTHGKLYHDTSKVDKSEFNTTYAYLVSKINEVHDQTYFYVAQGIEEMDDTLSSIDQRTYDTVYSYTQGLDLIYAAAIDEVARFDLTYALVLEELTARVEALENNS